METHKASFKDWVIIFLAAPFMHFLGLTLRIRETGRVDLGPNARQEEPPLWSLWHETILMSVWHHRDQGVNVMISASRDGELISRVAKIFGYSPIRGSSSRGGKEAALEMVEALQSGKRCAITPDGPRGPRQVLKPGVVNLARLTGRPIVPFAFAAEHCWRLKSWDRFIIPKPFSRAVFVYGEPVLVSPDDDEGERLKAVQAEMNRVTEAADGYFLKKETGVREKPIP